MEITVEKAWLKGIEYQKLKSHTNDEVIQILYEQMEAMDFYGKSFSISKFWEKYKK